jgi:hypothetical protein
MRRYRPPNGAGIHYLLPATAYYSGAGVARVQEVPTSIGNLGGEVARAPRQLDTNIAARPVMD